MKKVIIPWIFGKRINQKEYFNSKFKLMKPIESNELMPLKIVAISEGFYDPETKNFIKYSDIGLNVGDIVLCKRAFKEAISTLNDEILVFAYPDVYAKLEPDKYPKK